MFYNLFGFGVAADGGSVGKCGTLIKALWGVLCCVFALAVAFLTASLGGCGREENLGSYTVDIDFDGERVKGVAKYTLTKKDVGDKLVFCYYPAALCGGTMESVQLNGADIKVGRLGERNEFFAFDADFKAEDVVKFEYSFMLEESKGRLGITDKTVNFALFYPMKCVKEGGEFIMHEYTSLGDPFYFDFCNLDLRLSVPSTYTIACGGYPEDCRPEGNKTMYAYTFKKVRNVAFSLSELYNVVTKKSGYKSINYYFYDDSKPEETLNEVVSTMNFFDEKIGDYAYNILTFAQSPYEYGGMEYSGYFVVGETAKREDYIYAAVHETAHQWFPMVVGSDEYMRPCFDEGLAEAMSIKYFESKNKKLAKEMYLYAREAYEGYKLNCLALGKKPLEKPNLPLSEYSSGYEYTANAYYASSCVFVKALDAFGGSLSPLKNFYNKNKFKNATAKDFYAGFSFFKRGIAKNILEQYV